MIEDKCLTYKNVLRKGKPAFSTLRRWCVCAKDELLCWHLWLAALKELRQESGESHNLLFAFSAQCVTNTLQSLLLECGLSVEEASRFTTHSFRRGAGVDVLEAESTTCSFLAADHWRRTGMYGLPGMLRMGEWASKASSTHYATADEQSCAGMASISWKHQKTNARFGPSTLSSHIGAKGPSGSITGTSCSIIPSKKGGCAVQKCFCAVPSTSLANAAL